MQNNKKNEQPTGCIEKAACQDYCGMCDLDLSAGESRQIIAGVSLFGACRLAGECLDDCGLCMELS